MYQVKKIAENNVELRYSKEVETTAKTAVEAFVDPPQVYGQTRLEAELAALQKERDRINNFDSKAELDKLQEKEDMLREIEDALNDDTIE